MIVIKFGGTSVGDAQRVANAIDIVAERRERDPIVVVSALAGVTNDLVASTEAACEGDMERVNEIVRYAGQRRDDDDRFELLPLGDDIDGVRHALRVADRSAAKLDDDHLATSGRQANAE